MGDNDVSLIVVMLKDIKETLFIHGTKIDNIKEISSSNCNDIENVKNDVLAINFKQKSFIRKPKVGAFSFWVKIGGLISAFVIALYQAYITIGK